MDIYVFMWISNSIKSKQEKVFLVYILPTPKVVRDGSQRPIFVPSFLALDLQQDS